MDGIALVVPQATAETPVFSYPPADLGESFQAIFVGVNPDDTTKGLVATVTKKLYALQASWLQTHNHIVQAMKFNEAEVAKWREKQVVETITRCFEEQSAEFAADVDAAGGIGETKYRGPADAQPPGRRRAARQRRTSPMFRCPTPISRQLAILMLSRLSPLKSKRL